MRFARSISFGKRAGQTTAVANLDREVALIWLVLRSATWAFAIFISALFPILAPERLIPIWPPSVPFSDWFERALLLPWQRWDLGRFVIIVGEGYRADNGTAQFHPLLFWLATPISRLSGMPMLGLMVVSSVASLALLLVFERYARLDLAQSDARTATLLLACAPLGFILFAPYTEGLFMLASVLCLLLARRRRWWLAGVAGAAAVLTRQQGLFLVVPIALEIWDHMRNAPDRAAQIRRARQGLPALAMVPFGLLIWLLYRGLVLGDVRPDTTSLQSWIYSLLISPSANEVVPIQAFILPWDALIIAFGRLFEDPRLVVFDLVFGLAFLVLVGLAWPRLKWSERAYTLIIVLVSFAYYTGPEKPYMGLPRHLLLAFPVFVGIAPLIRGRISLIVLILSLTSALFLQLMYHLHSWVP